MTEAEDWGFEVPVLATPQASGAVRFDVVVFDGAGGVAWTESIVAASDTAWHRAAARRAFERRFAA